jgi:transposase-like protein
VKQKKRNSYGLEFKAKVGLEAVRGVKTPNEITQEYGVHPVLVGQWKKEILTHAGAHGRSSELRYFDRSCSRLYGLSCPENVSATYCSQCSVGAGLVP